MGAPITGKVARGLGRVPGLDKFIDQHAATLQQIGQELDGFEGGTANANMANATLDQMRGYARMQSLGSGSRNGLGAGVMQGLSSGGNNGSGFDPLSGNACGSGGCGPKSGADFELQSMMEAGGGGGYFEDRVFALMIKIVEDYQKQIEKRLQKLQQEAQVAEAQQGMGGGGGGGGGGNGQESRNIEFEKIKFDMQKLSQMQQALSNILNTMDELAKSAIRHIKAG